MVQCVLCLYIQPWCVDQHTVAELSRKSGFMRKLTGQHSSFHLNRTKCKKCIIIHHQISQHLKLPFLCAIQTPLGKVGVVFQDCRERASVYRLLCKLEYLSADNCSKNMPFFHVFSTLFQSELAFLIVKLVW